MEVIQTAPVSAAALYRMLVTLLQEDYFGATGQPLAEQAIRHGLSYVKRFGKKEEHAVQVMVDQLEPDHLYKVAISSNRGVQWLSYELTALPDGKTQICYREDYLPEGRFNAWNYKLMLPLMKKSLQERMKLQIAKLVEFTLQKEVRENEQSTNG